MPIEEKERRDNFLRLAPKRAEAVREKIRVLANCANTYSYAYTPDEVREMFDMLADDLTAARKRFEGELRNERWAKTDDGPFLSGR